MENPKKTKKSLSLNSKKHTCEYCGKGYVREENLERHYEDCHIKARIDYMDYDDRPMKIWAAISFRDKTDKMRFAKSSSYLSVVQTMAEMDELGWIFVLEYMLWLISNKVHFSHWVKRSYYEKFLNQYLRNETPADAIPRSLEYIIEKGHFGEFFKKTSPNKIITYLECGYVSPWILLVYPNADEFYTRLNEHQLEALVKCVNFDIYHRKAERFPKSINRLKKELTGVEI